MHGYIFAHISFYAYTAIYIKTLTGIHVAFYVHIHMHPRAHTYTCIYAYMYIWTYDFSTLDSRLRSRVAHLCVFACVHVNMGICIYV